MSRTFKIIKYFCSIHHRDSKTFSLRLDYILCVCQNKGLARSCGIKCSRQARKFNEKRLSIHAVEMASKKDLCSKFFIKTL
jgi:hypothetical protein